MADVAATYIYYDTLQDLEASPVFLRAMDFGGKGSAAFNLMLQQRDFKQYQTFKRSVFVEAFGPAHMTAVYPSIESIFRERFNAAADHPGPANITDILHAATMQASASSCFVDSICSKARSVSSCWFTSMAAM